METPTTRTDERLAQARAEAEREALEAGTPYLNKAAARAWFGDGVERGVVWADANPKPRTITRERFDAAEKRYWNYVHSNGDADLALLAAFHSAGIEVTDDE